MAKGNAFEAGDFQALAFFEDFNVDGGVGQRVVGAGVEPREAAGQGLNLKLSGGEICLINGGYFQLAARRRANVGGDVNNAVGIEIQPDNRIVAARILRFFFDREAVAVFVELRNAVALGIVDPIAENRSEIAGPH